MSENERDGEAEKPSKVGRIGAAPARIVLGPARAVVRSSHVGRFVRSGVGGVTASAGGMFEAEAEKAVDAVLAGPMPEAVTRALIERQVVERVASELIASGDLERMLASAAQDKRTEQLVQRVLASPGVEQMLIDAVDSKLAVELTDRFGAQPGFQRVITDAVRAALARQSASLADAFATSARRIDGRLEAPPRRWVGRPPREVGEATAWPVVPYAGLALTRRSVHRGRACCPTGFPGWLRDGRVGRNVHRSRPLGFGWRSVGRGGVARSGCCLLHGLLDDGGSDPGMSLLRLRLVDAKGGAPGFGRSLLRLVGALVAVSIFFVGFLPVLVDDRRRALQDFLARTVVIHDTTRDTGANVVEQIDEGEACRLPNEPSTPYSGAQRSGDGTKDAQGHQAARGEARSPDRRRRHRRMTGAAGRAAVDLYWLPLGAGGHSVRVNGRAFEAVAARLQHRSASRLYHSALEVQLPATGRFVIEQAPIPNSRGAQRGVVVEGPVGTRWLGHARIFRYEVRRWRGGTIPDIAEAVESPHRLTEDPRVAQRLWDCVPDLPAPIWGRDGARRRRDVELQLDHLVAARAKRSRNRDGPAPSRRSRTRVERRHRDRPTTGADGPAESAARI